MTTTDRRRLPDDARAQRLEKVNALAREGYSKQRIGVMLGISEATVAHSLNDAMPSLAKPAKKCRCETPLHIQEPSVDRSEPPEPVRCLHCGRQV